jgi:hypothetical protein
VTGAILVVGIGLSFRSNRGRVYNCDNKQLKPYVVLSETATMSEHPQVLPDLPREIILQILRAATEQNQMISTAFRGTIPATPSRYRYQETFLIIVPSKKDVRTLLAVSKGIRRDMISLLWREIMIPMLHLGRVSLYLPVTCQPVTAFSRHIRRDLDEQRRDWSHTVILNPSFRAEYPRNQPRYIHKYKLDVDQGNIMHPFNGVELSTLSHSAHPTIPAVVKSHEDFDAIVLDSADSARLASLVIYCT